MEKAKIKQVGLRGSSNIEVLGVAGRGPRAVFEQHAFKMRPVLNAAQH